MEDALQALIRKLREHTRLSRESQKIIETFSHEDFDLKPDEDLIRQGDKPRVSALVISGFLARYHLLPDGRRQYLSFHMAGDMPDSQALFIEKMDHAVCAIGPARVAVLPHRELLAVFEEHPSIGFAIWRETLIDAAIFREAITSNGARQSLARMAHLLCEIFYRARSSRITQNDTLIFPISLIQLGEAIGMAIATVNRTLKELRDSGVADFRSGELIVKDWDGLVDLARFDPAYLHLKRPPADLA